METQYLRIKISPEVIKGDYSTTEVSGVTYSIISGMSQVLSGGTNGDSLLTDLSIPITLNQSVHDFGYYDGFDGDLLQKDVVTNFVFSQEIDSYTLTLFNTSQIFKKKFLSQSTFKVDWGDNSPLETISTVAPLGNNHTYISVPNTYTIKLIQTNPWGIIEVSKTITVPYELVPNDNPYGEVVFTSFNGPWSATPVSYDFIFWGDERNTVQEQLSSNFISVPFYITANTKSQITELAQYGPTKYITNQPVFSGVGVNRIYVGTIFGVDPQGHYTGYTVNNIDYYDFSDGTTISYVQSSGITPDMIHQSGITKNEYLIGVVDQPEIFSNVFIERGKESGTEKIQRLGDVNNIGELTKYGYKFFKVKKY